MSDKFKNKYRIPSARLRHWDYSTNAQYFVTICTAYKICWFGEIINETMELSEIGKIAQKCWNEIPFHFPFVKLGAFVVKPNHVHGIIIIDKSEYKNVDVAINVDVTVETQYFASLPSPSLIPSISSTNGNKFGPQSQNLASIVRGFKIGVTKFAGINTMEFKWQSRYHDHIIRNEESFQRIEHYIINNPARWLDDVFYER